MYIPAEVSMLLERLKSNGFEAFVVGGCVRDSLLGLSPADWDICTSALPEEVQRVFCDFNVIPTGIKHGTVTVISGGYPVEITTYRKDGRYLDNRHPESVIFTSDIGEDLKRRDFTINAMAYSPQTGILDYYDGEKHLQDKVLSCVGNPIKRFSEDALRILRGLRFSAAYRLSIEPETVEAIHRCRSGLNSVSAERIFTELKKLLLSPDFARVLEDFPDILGTIFPHTEAFFIASAPWRKFIHNLSSLPPSFPLRLASIFYWFHAEKNYLSICNSSLRALKPDKKTFQHAELLIQLQTAPFPKTLAETRFFIHRYGNEILTELILWRTIQFKENVETIKKFQNEIQEKNLCCTINNLAISGNDLKERGLSGTEIGQALDCVLEQVMEGNLPNEKEVLLNFLFS